MEKKKKTEIQTSCDTCAYLIYDEEYEEYVCDVSMDEDEIARLYGDSHYSCPYYKNGDEYRVVRGDEYFAVFNIYKSRDAPLALFGDRV